MNSHMSLLFSVVLGMVEKDVVGDEIVVDVVVCIHEALETLQTSGIPTQTCVLSFPGNGKKAARPIIQVTIPNNISRILSSNLNV